MSEQQGPLFMSQEAAEKAYLKERNAREKAEWFLKDIYASPLHSAEVSAQNRRGEWVPAIPLPFYGFRKKCSCGAKFWTMDGYRGHYAFVHILALDDATEPHNPQTDIGEPKAAG